MIKILDYEGKVTELKDIDLNSDDILAAKIEILSGDEILMIIDKTGHITEYDSSSSRRMDFYDGEYYVKENGDVKEFVTSDKWLNAKSSYDRQDIAYGFEV